jgi:hypothetical protein
MIDARLIRPTLDQDCDLLAKPMTFSRQESALALGALPARPVVRDDQADSQWSGHSTDLTTDA